MIWIVVLPLLAASKVIIQGFISRNKCSVVGDSFLLNALIFGAAAIVLFLLKFSHSIPVKILLPAVLFGICNTAFQCLYLSAFKTGPVGMTTVINNFNLVFPILCGALLFNETITKQRFLGMLFMAVALVLLPRSDGGKINWKWFMFSVLALVASGSTNTLLTVISHRSYTKYESDMIIVTGFVFASFLSLLISAFFRKNIHMKLNVLYVGGILICGLFLGLFNCLTVVALKTLPAVILYPTVNVLTIIPIVFADYFIYKERISKRQIVGIFVAACSIFLMN